MSDVEDGAADVAHALRFVRGDFKVDRDKRTIFGTVMPYNETALVSDNGGRPYEERFAPSSLARSIDQRGAKLRLFGMHARTFGRFPVGKPHDFDDKPDGLHGAFRVFNTQDGDDTLELADPEVGGLTGFSVGFSPVRSEQDGDVTVRVEASLSEVSVVDVPAYAGATIEGIRMMVEQFGDEDLAWLNSLTPASRHAIIQRLASLDPQDGTTPDTAPLDPQHGDPIPYAAIAARIATL